jgi:hypothetical protein
MIWPQPKMPGGTDPRSRWEKSVEERLRALRPMDVPGAMVQRTTRGFAIIPKAVTVRGGASVSCYKFKANGDDYIICRSWDGLVEGDSDVKIAKVWEIRNSITTQTMLDGTVLTFSQWDLDAQSRVATSDDNPPKTETQVINPPYLADPLRPGSGVSSLIWAVPAFTGVMDDDPDNEKPIGLLELNQGRAWTRKFE